VPGRGDSIETADDKPESPIIGIALFSRKVTDDVIKALKVFPKLRKVYLQSTSVTDAGLTELCQTHPALKELRVFSDQVGDAGLKAISQLTGLEVLELGSPEVTSAGLKELRNLKKLRVLTLGCLAITDGDLKALDGLKDLEQLNIVHAQLSEPAMNALLKALPKLAHLANDRREVRPVVFERVPPILAARPLKAAAGDDPLQKVMKARYNAAVSELLAYFWEYQRGQGSLDVMYDACQRLTRAGLDLHPARADQILLRERLLELARIVEETQEARYDAGRIGVQYLERSRYERFDLEVQLQRLKQTAK